MRGRTIGEHLSLDDKILSKDISCLLNTPGINQGTENTIKKVISILRKNGYNSIEDVVSVNKKEILLLKYIGLQTFDILIGLLEMLAEAEKRERVTNVAQYRSMAHSL